jgi:hydroxymethylpyrimidine/phosphomethylpyrimidine kinase
MIPQVLTIAGSDSGGGAGIQADLKSIQANGGYGLSVLTAVTAQNTQEVTASMDLPPDLIEEQLAAVFSDFEIGAAKTGMLGNATTVHAVATFLRERKLETLVVDPVMVSKSGFPLLEESAIAAVREQLLPLARLVTPNRAEAEILSGVLVRNEEDAREAGLRILESGCRAVLIKGGHIDAFQSTDYLVTARGCRAYAGERIQTKNTHGTGCTLSAAIATWLAHGLSLEEAVQRSKLYVTEAIKNGLSIGSGHGPTDHFWFLRGEKGKWW